MFYRQKIFSWTHTNVSYSDVVVPETVPAIQSIIQTATQAHKKVLPRGAGCSYGDQSLNHGHIVVDMTRMKDILEWDKISGLLRVQAGATFDQVLVHCLGDGWAPAVIPGTRYVSMGGALANNIHGKNSYIRANFGSWIKEFKIVVASGEEYMCSRTINSDLFFGVIGGAGLLGIVTEMTVQLVRIPSAYLSVKVTTAPSLRELMDQLDEASEKNDFAIAQVDCFPGTVGFGRGTVSMGSFVESFVLGNRDRKNIETMGNISPRIFGIFPKKLISKFGKYILNDYTMRLVSGIKYYLDTKENSKEPRIEDIFHFTFLLDQVPRWKDVFRHGFFEYQALIPKDLARIIIPQLITLTHQYRMPAYLSAIKIHRKDDFLLSYAMDGYSFAMDIPRRPKQKEKQDELFRKMNNSIIAVHGIVYLAKDANLTAHEFRNMYTHIDQFLAIKKKYDPDELFQSDMYRRLFQSYDPCTYEK